jgi:Ribbon-helix-helix protein, copG family
MPLDSRLTFRLQGDDLFELHRIAQAEGVSISNAVRQLIRAKAPVTGSLPESRRSGIWPFIRR